MDLTYITFEVSLGPQSVSVVRLVDAAAGGADSTLDFVGASDQVLKVVEGEPTSIMDAYALVKAAHLERNVKNFSIFIYYIN